MSEELKILNLLENLKIKEFELECLIYGSVEIRTINNKKYIYRHTRVNGIPLTKYVGEYSSILHDLILSNNIEAKELKKDIRKIEKELKKIGYVDRDLDEDILANIDFAKRHLADTIYKQAVLEGVSTTLLDTENIIENGIVNNMKVEDIMKIVNMRHAWDFILNKNIILMKSTYSILSNINKMVVDGFYYGAGVIRCVPVKIGGTDWIPELPILDVVKDDILKIINKRKSAVDIAIDLLLYVVRKQIFIDGNKRTSVIFANHFLISKGKGLIVIPVDKVEEYKELLINYYETNNKSRIHKFIKEECYLNIKAYNK